MPSIMIHLLTARLVRPEAEAPYLLGNLAPDAVGTREKKDRGHFRVSPDREGALRALAAATDPADPFAEGVLVHLYTDRAWDEGPMADFIRVRGAGWFLPYRHEIALASAWLFHHADWGPAAFYAACGCQAAAPRALPDAGAAELTAFLARNLRWHEENDVGPSGVYPPALVDAFAARTAAAYRLWRKKWTFAAP